MSGYEKQVTQQFGCTWKDAKEMIEQAKEDRQIDGDLNDSIYQDLLPRIAELWEARKPSHEEIQAKKALKKTQQEEERKKAELFEEKQREMRRENDKKFVDSCLCCVTLGLSLWWRSGVLKNEEEQRGAAGNS